MTVKRTILSSLINYLNMVTAPIGIGFHCPANQGANMKAPNGLAVGKIW